VKIAFVAPFFGVQAAGGAEFAARSLAHRLADAGHKIEILTTCLQDLTTGLDRNTYPEGVSTDGHLQIRRFTVPQVNMLHFGQLNDLILSGTEITFAEELQFMTRHGTSPTLLEWINHNTASYDWFCFIPYLFGTTCFGVPIAGRKSVTIPCFHNEGYTRLKLVQRMTSLTERFVFNAAAEQRFAQERFAIPADRCHTVGLGMETNIQGDPERFCRTFGLREPFVLYAGRRDTTKNVHTLIQYFQAYKQRQPGNLKLALIGPAPLPMAAPDPDVIDLGFVTEQEKYDAYAPRLYSASPP
jgi:glycosyltransferase involved in cell wall biosynthesis